ncbi:GGDEF domain-containing protein [Kineococcus gypseus]|uniref:GGDEF domain-containing protein n=1 Tax=Kineococcus gypseus TaxID=1637102 RepID=UPI003D7EB6A3
MASTRAAGVLALVGALYMLLTGLLVPQALGDAPGALAAVVAAACALALVSAVPTLLPHRAPASSAAVLGLLGLAEIVVLNLHTRDVSFSGQVFLGWPALYAAYHLRRGAAWTTTALCLVAQVGVLLTLDGWDRVQQDSPAWATTFAAVTWLTSTWRDRHEALLARLRAEAAEDALTGLASRRAFDRALARHLQRGTVGALLLVDVDRFKQVNDEHGHAAGDAVLRVVADELRAVCRPGDVVARLGGDELAALLLDDAPRAPGTACPLAREAAERFRAAVAGLRAPTADGRPGPRLSVSVGLAGPGAPGEGPAALLARADAALYAAKRGGRDRVVAGPAQPSAQPSARPSAQPSALLRGGVGGAQ